MKISWRLGLGITSGVPALVFVSMGPIAALVGPVSVLVWLVSAMIGMVMAILFAELGRYLPGQAGGIGVLSALALKRRTPFLAVLSQWSYWLGWSPALAINSAIIGLYAQSILMPHTSPMMGYAIACVIIVTVVFINYYGIMPSAKVQSLLALCTLAFVLWLFAIPWFDGLVELNNLTPFVPPGGWMSSDGIANLSGALFVAGWSAYGSEIGLTYTSEYKRETADARLTVLLSGAFSVAIYFLVPLTLVGVLGAQNIQEDASVVLIPFAQLTTHHASPAVLVLLLISLLLASNMVMIASSRSIYQMSRNGYTWRVLSTLNRNRVPGNALMFDMAFNLLLLSIMAFLNGGEMGQAPVALLAAANVAYFISIVLGLIAVWALRLDRANVGGRYRAPRYVGGVGLGLALVNAALLAGAGAAWGWGNIGIGVLILVMGISLFIFSTGNKRLVFEKARGGTSDGMVLGSLVILSIIASIPQRRSNEGRLSESTAL